jgi:hypothetical protein
LAAKKYTSGYTNASKRRYQTTWVGHIWQFLTIFTKIHLDPEKYDEFLCEPDLENILTAIGSETSVHMCRSGTFVLVSDEVESITRFNYKRTELRKLTKEEREEEDSSVAARKLEMASLIK